MSLSQEVMLPEVMEEFSCLESASGRTEAEKKVGTEFGKGKSGARS